jgi:hypothetical protein
MATKYEKRQSALLGLITVISDSQQHPEDPPSKSYAKLLCSLDRAIDAAKESLPTYSAKDAIAVMRNAWEFSRRTMGDSGIPLGVCTSFILAALEFEVAQMTNLDRKLVFNDLHARVNACHKYFDRNLNKNHEYEQAAKIADAWGV